MCTGSLVEWFGICILLWLCPELVCVVRSFALSGYYVHTCVFFSLVYMHGARARLCVLRVQRHRHGPNSGSAEQSRAPLPSSLLPVVARRTCVVQSISIHSVSSNRTALTCRRRARETKTTALLQSVFMCALAWVCFARADSNTPHPIFSVIASLKSLSSFQTL